MCFPVGEERSEVFCGCVKSFNARRGFGFLSCEETALRYGRDVYLSKDEASVLSAEPAVSTISADTQGKESSKIVPVEEGDVLLFQVKLSTEGFPQAVQPQKIRRLCGVVRQIPDSASSGMIVATGEICDSGKGTAQSSQGTLLDSSDMTGAQVQLPRSECGQLQLSLDDEIAFCCVNINGEDGPFLEARLIELIHTSRPCGSVLGCFSLQLPRFTEKADGTVAVSEDASIVELQGHAVTDRIFLPEVPHNVTAADLNRFLGKIGGQEAALNHVTSALSFASIQFSSTESIARFLVQAAHTISEGGATQLARVGPCQRKQCTICASKEIGSMNQMVPTASSSRISFGSFEEQPSSDQISKTNCSVSAEYQRPEEANAALPQLQLPQVLGSVNCFYTAEHAYTVPMQQPVIATATPAPSPSPWRCHHGSITVAPAAPEMIISAQNGHTCSICIQWPLVVHATGYIVEIQNQNTLTTQKFMRVMLPEGNMPHLVDLQVDGMEPGPYAACIRCVAPCACESVASQWSYMQIPSIAPAILSSAPPIVMPAMPVSSVPVTTMPLGSIPFTSGAPMCVPVATAPTAILPSICPPPPLAPPSIPASVTKSPSLLPGIPEEVVVGSGPESQEVLTLD